MSRYVGLLRGINVGGRNKVAMSELRSLFESLGHTDVSTFIQSGNVIFSSRAKVTPKKLEAAIESTFGIDITVVLRTPNELRRVVHANPFRRANPSNLHVGFMVAEPAAAALAKIDAERFRPDEFAARGSELYLHLPNGMGRAKLPAYLDRQLEVPITVRNWNTVTKLLELAER